MSDAKVPRPDIPQVTPAQRKERLDFLMNVTADYTDPRVFDFIIDRAEELEEAAAAAFAAKVKALKQVRDAQVRNAMTVDVDNAKKIAAAATDALLAVENAQEANAASNIATQDYLQNITPGQAGRARAEEWKAEADWTAARGEVARVKRVTFEKQRKAEYEARVTEFIAAKRLARAAKIMAAKKLARASELAGSNRDGEKTILQSLLERAQNIIQGILSDTERSSTSSPKTAMDPNLVVATADEVLREANALVATANRTDTNVKHAQELKDAVQDMTTKVRAAISEEYYSPRQHIVAELEAKELAKSTRSPIKLIPSEIKAKARAAANKAVIIANSNNVGEETPIQNMLNYFSRMLEDFLTPKAASSTPVAASARTMVRQGRELPSARPSARISPKPKDTPEPKDADDYKAGGKGTRRHYYNYKKTRKGRVNKIYSKKRKTLRRKKYKKN